MEHYPRQWLWVFLGLAALSVMLYGWIFLLVPLAGEDFAFLYGGEPLPWDERFQWVIQRSWLQINDWNARLGEQLAIFWLNMPEALFWLVSVLSFLALAVLVAGVYSGCQGLTIKSTLALGLMFLLWPGLEVFFWKTANAAYLQPILLNLLCILAYRDAATIRWWLASKFALLGLTVVALLAGLSFENVPVAVAIYMAVALFISSSRRFWLALLPIMAMLMGWVVLLIAPSTQHRREFYRQMFGVEQTNLGYYVQRGVEVSELFLRTSSVLLAAALIALGYLAYLHWRGERRYDPGPYLTIVPAVLVVGSLIMAPYTEPRAFLLAWVLMFAVVVEACYQVGLRFRFAKWGLLLAMVVSLGFGVKTLGVYQEVSQAFHARETHILERVGTPVCEEGVEVSEQVFNYSYRYLNNRDSWYMENLYGVGQYYDCQLVKATDGE